MNKIIISNRQFALLTSGFMFGSAPLFIPSSVAAVAGQDAWISVIFATIAGLLIVLVNMVLGGMYPNKTLVEIIQSLLGKWLGGIVSISFIFLSLVVATQVVWYTGDFFTTTYEPEVSNYQINILFIAVLAIALLYGLEAVSRAIEIIFIIAFPLYISSMLMLVPNIKADNLLPILEKGISPAIKGTIPVMGYVILPLIILNMLFPVNLGSLKEAKKSMVKGYFLGIITSFVGVIMCILVLGGTVTANLRYPLFTITQEINIGNILTRVEALIVFVWLGTNFIAAFFYLYFGIIGLSQIIKLKDHKKIILPILVIVSVYSGFIYKNVPYEISWDSYVWPPVIFTFGFVLPVVLLIVTFIKRLVNKKVLK